MANLLTSSLLPFFFHSSSLFSLLPSPILLPPFSLLPFFFSLYFTLITPSFSDQLPSTSAASQTKFWSENVKNEMPVSISTKLSPLTKPDSDYFERAVSQKEFTWNTNFCSRAKLACKIDQSLVRVDGFIYEGSAKVYANVNPNNHAKIDPLSFFRSSNLKEGETIHLSNLRASLPHRAFLPPRIASKITLTLDEISRLFPRVPKQAIETTLSYCSSAGVKGELKSCPKSLEEMIGFSKTALRAAKLRSLTSKNTAGSGSVLAIGKVEQFNVEKFVACHEMFLPFATYYCHSLPSSRIYAVDLVEPEMRAPVNTAVAVCHLDTSTWPKEHVAFKILKFGPGQGEACHWMNQIDLAWIADVDNI